MLPGIAAVTTSEVDAQSWERDPTRAAAARPLAVHATVGLAVYAVVAAGRAFLPRSADGRHIRSVTARPPFDSWLRFDSAWYVDIARHGYSYHPGHQSSVAFFPVYPLTMRVVAALTGASAAVAGLVLTIAAGATASWLWWRWLGARVEAPVRRTAFLLLLLFPYAWYLYGTDYSDALFLALTLGAFTLAEERKWWAAGVIGALAAATRPVGPAVIVGLAVLAVVEVRRHRRATPLLAPALAAGGLAAWCAFLYVRFGDPLAFLTVQGAPGWNQGAGLHTWAKVSFFHALVGLRPFVWRLLPQAALGFAALAAVPAVWRRIGPAYGAYTLVVVGIPLVGTHDFQGLGRYTIAAFPALAVAALAVADRPWLRRFVLTASATTLVVLAALFGAGNYLA